MTLEKVIMVNTFENQIGSDRKYEDHCLRSLHALHLISTSTIVLFASRHGDPLEDNNLHP